MKKVLFAILVFFILVPSVSGLISFGGANNMYYVFGDNTVDPVLTMNNSNNNTYLWANYSGIFFENNNRWFNINSNLTTGGGGNIFNQDLNTTDNVIFNNITVGNISCNNISCRVQLSTTQNVVGMAWVKLLLATINYDYGNNFNVANNRYIIPKDGLYHIGYSTYIQELPDRIQFGTMIYKNGAASGGFCLMDTSTGSVTDVALSGSDVIECRKNDYIELFVYHRTLMGTKPFPSNSYTNYMYIDKVDY